MFKNAIWIAFALVYSAPSFAEKFDPNNGWEEVVPDSVYKRLNFDGTEERVSFGSAGVAFERKLLVDRLEDVRKSGADSATDGRSETDRRMSEIQKMIDFIDQGSDQAGARSVPVSPTAVSSTMGPICGIYGYRFDSDLTVTSTKATLKGTNTGYFWSDIGPPITPPTSALFSVRLGIVKAVGAPETLVRSDRLDRLPWDVNGDPYLSETIVSSSSTPQSFPYPFCTYAEFQATMKVYGFACNSTNDYVSWTKTYPTCTP